MASRTASRRRASKAPSRPSRRGGSKAGPGPLVWIGASAAAWIVWNLTRPSTASASEGQPGSTGQPGQPGKAGAPSLPPSALPTSPPSTLLRRGSTGPAVLSWQTTLVYGGYLPDAPTSRDSSFGPLTEAATKVFQEKAGIAVDGVVGPATRAAAARLIQGV